MRLVSMIFAPLLLLLPWMTAAGEVRARPTPDGDRVARGKAKAKAAAPRRFAATAGVRIVRAAKVRIVRGKAKVTSKRRFTVRRDRKGFRWFEFR